MKLLFLCSSLEPGRDGVGDYTRRLAGECLRQGHEVRLLSLNDKGEIRSRLLETNGVNPKSTIPGSHNMPASRAIA